MSNYQKVTSEGANCTGFVTGLVITTHYNNYHLVNVYIAMEHITMFNGTTHYFDWAIFHSYVKLPEDKVNPLK